MSVYIAAASSDIIRARRWRARLHSAGISCISSWMESVDQYGGNPRDATAEQRLKWTMGCLMEVADASVLWLLVPPPDRHTRGAWGELTYASSCGLRIISSGDTRQSIFTALGDEFADDDDAFRAVLEAVRA